MAIQSRRGNIANFDKSKMLPGEFGVALDSQEAFICFGAGVTKKMATDEDYQDMIDESVIATENAKQATVNANTAVADFRALEVTKLAINDAVKSTASGWSSNKISSELDTAKSTLNTSLANQIGITQGSNINLPNTYNGGLLLKELQGKTVVNGVPSGATPSTFTNVGDNGSVVAKVCRKNFLDFDSWKQSISSAKRGTLTWDTANKSVTLTATENDAHSVGDQGVPLKIFVKPNATYTLSWEAVGSSGLVYIFNNGSSSSSKSVSNTLKKLTFTTNSDTYYITFRIGVELSGGICTYSKLQLEENTTSSSFEQYKEQLIIIPLTQPLRSVGSVYDRGCVKNGSLWGNERKFAKVVFDGSSDEKWLPTNTNTEGKWRYIIPITNGVISDLSNKNAICSHFELLTAGQTFSCKQGLTININPGTNLLSLYLYYDGRTVDEFRTWLQANPITLVYKLATPVFEPYSQSLQDTLNKLQSNQGVTNVFTTDALQPNIIVEYGKTDTSALSIYASNVSDNKLDKTSVANNLITTVEGTVLDGRQGKALNDKIGILSNLTTTSKTDLVSSVNEVKASVDGVNNNLLNKSKFNSANYSYVYLIGACRTSGKCECVFSFPLTYSTKPTVTVTRSLGFYDRTYGNVPVTIVVTEVGSVIFEVTHSSYVAGSLYSIGAWFSVDGTIV